MIPEKQSRSFQSLIMPTLEQIYRHINNSTQLSIFQCLNSKYNLICAEGSYESNVANQCSSRSQMLIWGFYCDILKVKHKSQM